MAKNRVSFIVFKVHQGGLRTNLHMPEEGAHEVNKWASELGRWEICCGDNGYYENDFQLILSLQDFAQFLPPLLPGIFRTHSQHMITLRVDQHFHFLQGSKRSPTKAWISWKKTWFFGDLLPAHADDFFAEKLENSRNLRLDEMHVWMPRVSLGKGCVPTKTVTEIKRVWKIGLEVLNFRQWVGGWLWWRSQSWWFRYTFFFLVEEHFIFQVISYFCHWKIHRIGFTTNICLEIDPFLRRLHLPTWMMTMIPMFRLAWRSSGRCHGVYICILYMIYYMSVCHMCYPFRFGFQSCRSLDWNLVLKVQTGDGKYVRVHTEKFQDMMQSVGLPRGGTRWYLVG